jgi:hypothetical protein
MALHDPVSVYTSASNLEAELICNILQHAGIEAHVMEDLSLAGLWVGGTIPGIHTPKVWVNRDDLDQAAAIIHEYERRKATADAERAPAEATEGDSIEATCEECRQTSAFPAAQRGTVQNCPACGALMDVGLDSFTDEWTADDPDGPEAE